MFPVSDAYLAAMRSPVITDKVYGWIKMKSGEIIEITDEMIQQGSLVITRSTCGSQFDIGTFNAAQMSITLFDDAAYDREYGGAVVILRYSVLTDKVSDTWEDVPLGTFYIDGQVTVRKGGRVTLKAYDYTSNFDIQLPDLSAVTSLLEAITAIRQTVNIGAAFTDDEFLALPNADITPDFSNTRIQSCRDAIMWIAQAVGCCAFVDNLGRLALKRYSYAGGSDYVRYIDERERTKIEFTDTRTYLAYLQSYCDGKVKLYEKVSQWTGTDAPHIQEGALSLPENPVLFALSAEEQDAVNNNLLNSRAYPTRYIKAEGFVDPAIELLDTLAFRGGTIDIGQIISVCTEIKWRYRGDGTITCNNFEEYTDTASAADAVMLTDDTTTQSDAVPMRTPPKSQIEKRIDALEAAIGNSGSSETAEKLQTTPSTVSVVTHNDGTDGVIVMVNDEPVAKLTASGDENAGFTIEEINGQSKISISKNSGSPTILVRTDPSNFIVLNGTNALYANAISYSSSGATGSSISVYPSECRVVGTVNGIASYSLVINADGIAINDKKVLTEE